MIISLPIILLIVESINNENPTITLSRNWKQIVGFSLYVPFVLYTSISVGLPSVLHLAISKPAEIEVTVEHKGNGRRGRGPYIYVEEYTYFLNNQVYGIQKEQWETLKPGNKIQLFGKKSYFGFSYSKYKIIR